MNWSKALIAGLVGGVVMNLASFVMHGIIMGQTYTKYPVFTQEEANPLYFFLIAILIAVPASLLFAKTRNSWAPGVFGGISFGLFLGLVSFFPSFYNPLVLEGFPYHLSWCWGGINLISFAVLGTVLGAMYKKT